MNPKPAAGIRVYKNNYLLIPALALFCAATGPVFAGGSPPPATISIAADKVTAQVNPMLYGLMTEEINYSYDGGLYGELIRNRTFRNNATNAAHWSWYGDAGGGSMSLDNAEHMNDVLPISLKLEVTRANAKSKVGIANEGYWGIPVKPNTRYRASFYAKGAPGFTGPLTVSIINASNHDVIHATAQVPIITEKWHKYEVTLTTGRGNSSKDNLFVITAETPGTVWLNMVSLFPPTFNDRPNGNRIDLMQLLGDMKPAFLRFPGGNYLEGNTYATRYDWKTTIGSPDQRPGHFDDAWGYWSSDGLGLLEFLEWCEDLHMKPVLAVYGGYSMRQGAVNLENELDPLVQDALDEIEYVTGNSSTKWGGRRVQDGHAAAFKLEYVEIGNEDNLGTGPRTYDARFARFYDAIKAKYPQLKVISTAPSSTHIVTNRVPDVIDDHYYSPPQRMQQLATRYDDYPRTGPKIFVGEYASQTPGTNRQVTPCLDDALGDAAFLTGLERNADVVSMASYAPLLVNVSNPNGQGGRNNPYRSMQWATDLIGYDALVSFGSPSYYVQKMFGMNRGDVVLSGTAENVPSREWAAPAGRRGGQPAAPVQVPTLFYVATRENQSGTILLKVVNAAETEQKVHVKISGAARVDSGGEEIVLKGKQRLDINTIANPMKIVPTTSRTRGFGKDFNRTFPPLSVTILKINAK